VPASQFYRKYGSTDVKSQSQDNSPTGSVLFPQRSSKRSLLSSTAGDSKRKLLGGSSTVPAHVVVFGKYSQCWVPVDRVIQVARALLNYMTDEEFLVQARKFETNVKFLTVRDCADGVRNVIVDDVNLKLLLNIPTLEVVAHIYFPCVQDRGTMELHDVSHSAVIHIFVFHDTFCLNYGV